jgi:hypothetical protein
MKFCNEFIKKLFNEKIRISLIVGTSMISLGISSYSLYNNINESKENNQYNLYRNNLNN